VRLTYLGMVVYDACMFRTNIYLTERQRKALAKEAMKLGLSVSELIRRVLDEHIDSKESNQ